MTFEEKAPASSDLEFGPTAGNDIVSFDDEAQELGEH